ncbi:autotransporter domain-containing protein [Pantoea sp. B65]|uniref:autotransporter family protein n=1 Tax=Pantoea sp. B65 TaxID=2813359 RepID=UPI0039B3B648
MTSVPFKVKPLVLAISSLIALLPQAEAVPSTTIVISENTTSTLAVTTPMDSVSVTDSGSIVATSGNGISNSSTIGTLSNAGTISGREGIFSTGSIDSIINSGTITSTDGVIWASGGTVGSITNSGNITGPYAVVIQSGATLNSFDNTGTISGHYGFGNFYGGGSIGSITNSGLITGDSFAIYNSTGSIGSITNSGSIEGNISSANGLIFNGGSGSTFGTLTGYQASGQGTITITSGDLVFASGNMLLNDNITLGSGQVSNQAAALQVNNIVAINGNYSQDHDASLLIGVADNAITTGAISTDSGYGRLVVSGSANIASGSSVSLVKLGSYAFAQGQRYVVVQAASDGTEYHASSLNYSASGYTGTLTGAAVTDSADSSKTDLVLTLVALPDNSGGNGGSGGSGSSEPKSFATTSTAKSAFSGLFNYPGTDASLLNVFNASAALGNSAEANRAGAQLSPAAMASASARASSAPTNAVLNVISQRADVMRQSPASGSGIATGENDGDIAVWGRGFGGVASQDQLDDTAGYDARFGGLLIGGDSAVGEHLRLGALTSYAGTAVDNTGDNAGSSVNIRSWGVFGYGSYDAQPWFFDLSTGAVHHQYDTKRQIDFTGFNGDASGSFAGMQYIVAGQTGYPFQLGSGSTTLTPIAGLTYSILRQNGYSESGGNGAGLSVSDATSTSLKSDLAVKLGHSFNISAGDLIPFTQLGWRHEFHDHAPQSAANFSADSTGSTSFISSGSRPIANTAVLSVGTTLVHNNNLSLSVIYTGELANSYDSHSGNLQLRWQF